MIPSMTPPYIASMGWILFMQKKGLFQQLFPAAGSWSEGFFCFVGLVLASDGMSVITGTVERDSYNENLLQQDKMELLRYPVHLNYA